VSVSDLKGERASAYVPQPSRDERKLLKNIHTGDFYGSFDKELQEKYYPLHLVCATYNENTPPIFSIGNGGKLSIAEERYYCYRDPDTVHSLNPFSLDDIKKIQSAAKIGIETEYTWRLETYRDLFQGCIPELSAILSQAVAIDEEDVAESA